MKLLGASVATRDAQLDPVIPENGANGNDGWTPILGGEADGTRSLLKIVDWTGGEGTKPQAGMYIGPAGYVATKAEGFNFNIAKRVMILSAQTNVAGVASFTFGATPPFTVAPAVRALPATIAVLSGPTKSSVSAVTATGCTVNVQQQAVLTGVVSALAGATANIIVIEA